MLQKGSEISKNSPLLICSFLLLTLDLAASSAPLDSQPLTLGLLQTQAIYGADNREEVSSIQNSRIQELARSVAALVLDRPLIKRGDFYYSSEETFAENHNTCSQVRFAQQKSFRSCSGFLIAEDKVVTAGHCVVNQEMCEQMQVLFDHVLDQEGKARTHFHETEIYRCQKILGRMEDDRSADYAVIQLDRAVLDRTPLELSDNKDLLEEDKIFMIGHPSGLPKKITSDARIREVFHQKNFFRTNLDAFGGNSGSPVFNAQTFQVEGILVRGERDFAFEKDEDCRFPYVVGEDEGRGEDVTFISRIRENGDEPLPPYPLYVLGQDNETCYEYLAGVRVREVNASLCFFGP